MHLRNEYRLGNYAMNFDGLRLLKNHVHFNHQYTIGATGLLTLLVPQARVTCAIGIGVLTVTAESTHEKNQMEHVPIALIRSPVLSCPDATTLNIEAWDPVYRKIDNDEIKATFGKLLQTTGREYNASKN